MRSEIDINQKAVLSTGEAAQYINVQKSDIVRLCRIGVIKAFRSGPNYKIPKALLEETVCRWAADGVTIADL